VFSQICEILQQCLFGTNGCLLKQTWNEVEPEWNVASL